MRWLYKYPYAEFPYRRLVDESARRNRQEAEYELVDTGVFDAGRYFDVELTYAKAAPDDICLRIDCTNRGPDTAPLHVLPTIWFRNTWAWGRDDRRPLLSAGPDNSIIADHAGRGRMWLAADGAPDLVFCDNESNTERLWGTPNTVPFPKDGINDRVVSGAATVNPAATGTKAAAWYRLEVPAGAIATLRLRLSQSPPGRETFGGPFDDVLECRRAEADAFYADLTPHVSGETQRVARRAWAGLLWSKKHYRYDVREWLDGASSTSCSSISAGG